MSPNTYGCNYNLSGGRFGGAHPISPRTVATIEGIPTAESACIVYPNIWVLHFAITVDNLITLWASWARLFWLANLAEFLKRCCSIEDEAGVFFWDVNDICNNVHTTGTTR